MTKREMYVTIINTNEITDEMKEFARKELEKMDANIEKRKNTLTKKQIENNTLKEKIVALLGDEPKTATTVGEEMEISTQKASALLRQLAEAGSVERVEVAVKGKGKQKGYKVL